MIRANLCAVTVVAFGSPSCDFFLLRHDPNALSERCGVLAVSRSVAALLAFRAVCELITLLFGFNSSHVAAAENALRPQS